MLILTILMALIQSVAPLSGHFSSAAPSRLGAAAAGDRAALAAGPELRLGVGAVKITPPAGAPMAGYYFNRSADGVHDDLWAKAMVLELGTARAALVACDISGLPRPVVEEARRLIKRRSGIPAGSVMISATHCHTGPVVLTAGSRYNLTGAMKRIAERYVAELPAKIAESVRLAAASPKPVRVSAGHGRETSLAFNRRYFMKDGTVKFNPGKLNPDIVRPAGPVDPDVPVVFFETPDARPVASYVNFAMHLDTVSGTEYSADYPYTLSRLLRDAVGGELFTLFTIGCAGNVNHFDVGWTDPQQGHGEAARIGTVLAAEVLKTLRRLDGVAAAPLCAKSEVVPLPLPEVRPEDVDWAKKITPTMGDKPDWSRFLELVKAFKIIDVAARAGRPIDAEVQVVALGKDIAWVGVPGELFVEHGLAIKMASPFRFTVVVELANDSIGYVPNLRAYDQGAYEVLASRCAPGSGEILVDAAVRLLVALHRAGS
jgi:neutral ceramidase